MKRNALILILSLLLVACSGPEQIDGSEALDRIEELDEKYNTSYKTETLRDGPGRQALQVYIEAVQKELRVNTTRHGKLLLQFRKQTLEAQYLFSSARRIVRGFGGMQGWECQDGDDFRRAMRLTDRSVDAGVNATKVLDTVLTENDRLRQRIGIGDEKPAFYNSDFHSIRQTARQGIAAYEQRCTEANNGRT